MQSNTHHPGREYTLDELENLPTINSGHTADLKVETETERIWLNRTGVEDGEPFDNGVRVEILNRGRWEKSHTYEAE